MDDFFTRALVAGVGVALVIGPLGCVIIWRRMAYFGDTLAHAALLGVALALLLDINMSLAVFVVCAGVSLGLIAMRRKATISSDALLGILAHSSLALGLVCLAMMSWVRVDLMSFLFGDILSVSTEDIAVIYLVGLMVLLGLGWIWRRLFAATVSEELAEAEGGTPGKVNVIFMLLMAVVIALSMKIVGVLLITALLIIPAATARKLTVSPESHGRSEFPYRCSRSDRWFEFFTARGYPVRTGHRGGCRRSVCAESYPHWTVAETIDGRALSEMDKAKLTKNQTLVLRVLSRAKSPLSAYDILERLQKQGFRAPPQVYRALEKLSGLGLIHRVETLNAFVACNHSEDQNHGTSAFAICDSCSTVVEFPCDKVAKQLAVLAKDQGFGLKSSTIELGGLCDDCRSSTG